MKNKEKRILIRIIITIILFILLLLFVKEDHRYALFLYMIPYLIIGYDIIKKAFKGISKKQLFDENFLMVIATFGSFVLKEYSESVMVMLLYQIGELFQSYAIGKSRKNISDLMNIRPDFAYLIKENGEIEKVNPYDVSVGSMILCKVGDKIPIDGIVFEGNTTVNTVALTGEPKPKLINEGDEVLSGCINMTSPIKLETTKDFDESTASKILDLVENASSNKSKSEDFITKFARYYTPVVCGLALALALLPPLFNLLLAKDANFSSWVYRSLTFLVISCPCALVISIPLSFFGGIGGASNKGIMIKGSNYLETLSKTKYVVFDKTGTMTKGVFEVSAYHECKIKEEDLLEYAAYCECLSNHPIAKSIVNKYGKEIDKNRIESIREIPGKGIIAKVLDKNVICGNKKLLDENGVIVEPCKDITTIVYIAIEKKYAGHIHIADVIKPTSKACVEGLKDLNIKRTIILSGDKNDLAKKIAEELGIDEVYGELLPKDKLEKVEKLLAKKDDPKETLVFVGDGINDAPVIAAADIGVSMGALGSDAAIEAADVVLMDDDPKKLVSAIKIAKKTLRIVYENIIFAIGIKVICLILGAFGIANMWLAIFADVGVMIIAVINALRALNVRNL